MFKVKKLSPTAFAVVVVRKQGAMSVEVPIYEVAGGRDPRYNAKHVAKVMQATMTKLFNRQM